VTEQQVARLRRAVEEGEAIAAPLGRVEQLAVVREVEGAAYGSTSTSTRAAAASERSSASAPVEPRAIT
jgi:hypothetical protein